MMYEPQTMIANLMATMDQINEQIQEVNRFAAANETPVSNVQYPDGRWVMAELSLAKAQVLHAMVLMEEQINREVVRKRNEEIFKEEAEKAMGLSESRIYVYNPKPGVGVLQVNPYSQNDEWVQMAAENNPDNIYFYARGL